MWFDRTNHCCPVNRWKVGKSEAGCSSSRPRAVREKEAAMVPTTTTAGKRRLTRRPPDTWYALAKRIWRRATWIMGEGSFATVSRCHPGCTVMLHADRDKALAA